MDSASPIVAILANDCELLQTAAWSLADHGYQVQTHRSVSSLSEFWQRVPIDFLIVDSSHPELEEAANLPWDAPERIVYAMLLHDMQAPIQQLSGCEAAFHDVLAKPFCCGEALARLRAGAALLQFERQRMRDQSFGATDGLLSRTGLVRNIEALWSDEPAVHSTPLLLAAIDAFELLSTRLASGEIDEALRMAAALVSSALGQPAWTAKWHAGILAIVAPEGSLAELKSAALQLDGQFRREFAVDRPAALPLTWTCLLAELPSEAGDAAPLIDNAQLLLRAALARGGADVVTAPEMEAARDQWQQEHQARRDPFCGATLRDLVTPLPDGVDPQPVEQDASGDQLQRLDATMLARDAAQACQQSRARRLAVCSGETVIGYLQPQDLQPLCQAT